MLISTKFMFLFVDGLKTRPSVALVKRYLFYLLFTFYIDIFEGEIVLS
jgi:hypothetical protein